MACDVYYLETVRDWFQEAVNVSDTDIVIAVQKGNPKGIQTLQDLARPGMRVAVGQPDQCTIGVLTRRLLEHEGLYDQLLKENVVTQTATSALLVPAVTSKSADAALAYRTDTLAERDKVDVVTVESELSKAIQPYSIARSSHHKELGRRLFRAIARSRIAFEAAGFHWRLKMARADEKTPAASNERRMSRELLRPTSTTIPHRVGSDVPFYVVLGTIGGVYMLLILGLMVADVAYMAQGDSGHEIVASGWAGQHPVAGGPGRQSDRQSTPHAGNPVLHQAESDLVHDHHDPLAVGGRAGRLPVVAHQVRGPEPAGCHAGHSHRTAAAGRRAESVDPVPVCRRPACAKRSSTRSRQ